MSVVETVSVGKSGDVPIPPSLRELVGIEVGSVVTLEARGGAIVIRPVGEEPELYTAQRKAEFLLSNAINKADYEAAREKVRNMGLNPDKILHDGPDGA